MGLALALERDGVPTIPVSTHVFVRLAKATALAEGMPTARNVYVPQPVVGLSGAELRAAIDGIDPVSRRPFMQGVIEGLTKVFYPEASATVVFVIMVLVLLLRPAGLFGREK